MPTSGTYAVIANAKTINAASTSHSNTISKYLMPSPTAKPFFNFARLTMAKPKARTNNSQASERNLRTFSRSNWILRDRAEVWVARIGIGSGRSERITEKVIEAPKVVRPIMPLANESHQA